MSRKKMISLGAAAGVAALIVAGSALPASAATGGINARMCSASQQAGAKTNTQGSTTVALFNSTRNPNSYVKTYSGDSSYVVHNTLSPWNAFQGGNVVAGNIAPSSRTCN